MADFFFESRVWVPAKRPEVFAFLADADNLSRLTPPWLGVRLLTPGPIGMSAGTVLDYRIRWLGFPIAWRTFIREYDPPFRFLDVQVRGPYARWEHRHMFLEEDGGTRVEDRVVYRLPLGPLGRGAQRILVGRQLNGIWRHRNAVIAERFGPVTVARG
jgi:ligand-binding SRPBCC domain-containing protein